MRLQSILKRLADKQRQAAARAARQRWQDELFPLLSPTRLEERRLLNAAPVVAPTPVPSKDSAGPSSSDSGAAPDQHRDITNLAVAMYGGPTHGNFSAEMQAHVEHVSHRGNGRGDSSADRDSTGTAVSTPAVAQSLAASAPGAQASLIADPADQPPVNTVPASQSTSEDTPLVIMGLGVADPDAGNSPIVSKFQVTSGTLSIDPTLPVAISMPNGTLQLTNGATIVGNGTATLQILGTTTQINATLAPGLTYTPALNYNGADTLTMVTNDLGATGTGGPLTDTDTVSIAISAVDDPPVNTVPGPQNTNENTPLVITGLGVADPDAGNSPIVSKFQVTSGTLAIDPTLPIAITLPNGTLQLTNGATIVGNGTATLQILGTTAQINATLTPGLTYSPALNYRGGDTLKMVTNDLGASGAGGPLTDTDTVAITVNPIDQPPVNTVPGPQSTNENTPLVITGLGVADPDAGNSPIVSKFQVTSGTLAIDPTLPIAITLPNGTLQLTNGATIVGNGTATLQILGTTAQINATLTPGLTYSPALNYRGGDTLKMVTNDLGASGAGGPLTDTDTVAITVNPIDQPPVNTVPGPQSTNENTPLVITGLGVADPDAGNSPIVSKFEVTSGTLAIDPTLPIAITLPNGTLQLTNGATIVGNGTATLQILGTTAQINATLAPGLTYTPALNYRGGDTLKMVTNDLGASGPGGPLTDTDTVAITVNPIDQPPVNTVPGPQNTNEDTPLVITGLGVADPDAGNSPIVSRFEVNNGTLAIASSLAVGSVLPNGTILLVNGATVLGNGSGTLQIVGTLAQINATLAPGLTYTPALNYNGAETLKMVTNDLGASGPGGPLTDTDTVAITINAVNDPPVNTVPGPQTAFENIPVVITGFGVADPDAGNSPIVSRFEVNHGTLSIDPTLPIAVTLPNGTLQLVNGATVIGNGTGTLQILGTIAQINATLATGLTYAPTLNYNGSDTLTMVTNDLGATGSGGPLTDTDTVAIDVLGVNAPSLTVTSPAVGLNGLPISLGISGALTDNNQPEVLSFSVSGVPTTAVLQDGLGGLHTGQTSYNFTVDQVTGLTLTMPDSTATNQFDLTVIATATNTTTNISASSAPGTISVLSQNPYPVLSGLTATNVDQGSASTLSGTISSTRASSFTVTVDWGDGSALQTFVVGQGAFALTHVYIYGDANPNPSEDTPVHVTVVDTFNKSTTGDTSLVVSNVAPTVSLLSITPGDIQIANSATLTGTITDPGPNDTFTVTINWDDGSAPEVLALAPGTHTFTLTHTFNDNVRGDPNQVNAVTVNVVDDHTGLGTRATTITVHDVAPIITNYTGTATITSNGVETISGTLSHPGTSPLTVTIDWEGTIEVIQNVPQGNFTFTHTYSGPPDQFNPSAPITVHFSVASDTNLSATASNTSATSGLGPGGAGELAFFYVQNESTLPQITTIIDNTDYSAVQPLVVTFTTVQFDQHNMQSEGAVEVEPELKLNIVDTINGSEEFKTLLPIDRLNNLPALFALLPDNHYRLYFVDQGTERLIMDVVVRRGKAIDPSEEGKGTQDRPPTSRHQPRLQLPAIDAEVARPEQALAPAAPGTNDAQSASVDVSMIENARAASNFLDLAKSADNASDDAHSPATADVEAAMAVDLTEPGAPLVVVKLSTDRPATAKYHHLLAPALAAVAANSVWTGGRWARQVEQDLARAPAGGLTKSARMQRRLRRQVRDNVQNLDQRD